jgi:ABC-2 type transport system permease protein
MRKILTSDSARIARKELLEFKRDGRLLIATIPLFITLSCAMVVGGQHYASASRGQAVAQREERARWLDKGRLNYHVAAHFGVMVFKPYFPLSSYDFGINRYMGSYTLLEAHRENLFQDKEADHGLPARRLSEMTVAVVLQVLVPLVLVVLGFDLISGERERGTWRQLLALGIEPRKILLGKAIAFALPVALIVIPILFLGSSLLVLRTSRWLDTLERLTALFVSYLAFAAVVCLATLAVTAFSGTSRRSLTLLLLFWFCNSLLGPRLAVLIASEISPEPPPVALQTHLDRELEAVQTRERLRLATQVAQYHVGSQGELPESVKARNIQENEADNRRVTAAVFQELYSAQIRQEWLSEAAGFLFPLLSVQGLSMGIAGSDLATHIDFANVSSAYRYRLEQILNEEGSKQDADTSVNGRELWERVAPFTYALPGLGWALKNHLIALAGLGFWLIVAVALSRLSLSRALKPDLELA